MGALFALLAVCGWYVAAMPPFGIESSAFTFAVAAAMLATGIVLANRNGPSPELPLPGQNLGRTVRAGPSSAATPNRVTTPEADQPRGSVVDRASSVGPVRDTALRSWGALAWLLATLLVVAVELWELFHSPRSLYPTLSSLANAVIGPGHRVGRAAAFVCWGACGLIVVSRPRRCA
jgi:hypothetical protein